MWASLVAGILAGIAATILIQFCLLAWFCHRNRLLWPPKPRRRKPLDSILGAKMQDPKHILASKTFWLHALTLLALGITALQGQDWLAQYPYATPILASVSAVVAIWVRFLTDSPVRIKSAAILLAAMLCASQVVAAEPHDALAEVNAERRANGLRPFLRDDGLVRGAMNVAKWRADRLIEGHTRNDFSGLPRGTRADAAGCAAWHGRGWGSCCTYENWTYAGAAYCYGSDGRRFMQLFVRR